MSAATMDGFDPLALPYAPVPSSIPFQENDLPNFDLPGNYLPLDMQDSYSHSNFDSDFRWVVLVQQLLRSPAMSQKLTGCPQW